jgi:crotonobetainyl-CoA:carnitine CoA-transferase CaiB-like acyl-CoA transferase
LTARPRPLDGIRVLDLTQIVAGPTCCFYLASLGAEVIRVERPGGDLTWKVPPFFGPRGRHDEPRRPDEVSLSGMKRNRGKRSLVVDLHEPEGVELVAALAERSDVLVENHRPGVAERLGLGWEKLRKRSSRLIYCSISGYGQDGPDRDLQAMDFTVQAATGLMAKTGAPDGPPTRVGIPIGDLGPATFAALAILAALRQRDQTGEGQRIDVSMYDVLVSWLWEDPLDEYEEAGLSPRTANRDLRGSPSNSYACADGWVNIVVTDDRQWADFVAILGRSELARYDTNVARVRVNDRVDEALGDWCRDRSTSDVVSRLRAATIPVAEVVAPWHSRTNPHAAARDLLEPLSFRDRDERSVTTDRLGSRFPVRFSETEVDTGPAEPPGTSTDPVLRELLDLDEAALSDLRSRGIIGS